MYVPEPCVPSPCGSNALCKDRNGVGACSCSPGYLGNPYEGCRPECVLNSDCVPSKSCVRFKCEDPCPGTCGQNAICQVINHVATCNCLPRFTGDPFRFCREEEIGTSKTIVLKRRNLSRDSYTIISIDSNVTERDKSLPTVALRTKQHLQRKQWTSSVHLFAGIPWFSTGMQARMRGQR